MINFEKFKQDLTVGYLAKMLADTYCEGACDYCVYDNKTCSGEDCEYGIKKWLERKVEENEN